MSKRTQTLMLVAFVILPIFCCTGAFNSFSDIDELLVDIHFHFDERLVTLCVDCEASLYIRSTFESPQLIVICLHIF